MKEKLIKVGISVGDINGIGLEIILKTFEDHQILELCTPIIFASNKLVSFQRKHFNITTNFQGIDSIEAALEGKLNVLNCWKETPTVTFGQETEEGGKYAYLRKAADLGSREAQYTVAEMLADIEDSEETQEAFKFRLNLVEQLWACASEQGLGEASGNLGSFLRLDKRYDEALKVSHQGVKNGDSISALVLSHAFESEVQADNLNFLDVSPDDERVKRYHMISSYLSRYDYLQPKVPDLDEIVPLPPAKLPKWDGKIAFQRWYEGEAPPKPSEALMQKLANQAGLRVDNGLDLETNLPKSVKK